ncbi:hypothetical protein [Halorussus marinus]|uniref:hypothetical protein n=1 Tax=Halorussus marinus TaxID=2505976 RepID=UPI00106F0854|nr:hypothetical protein [Halorussus marinus]
MALEVSNDTFYLVQLPNGKTIHSDEDEAIDYLQNKSNNVDPESEDVSVVKVSVDSGDWTIAEMSWQTIALRLMGEN